MKSLNPNDLGTFTTVENAPKIQIKDLLKQCRDGFKKSMITSQLEMMGIQTELTTTRTRFNGIRFWFQCPQCKRRVGVLFKHPIWAIMSCRLCLNLHYRKQRYKGMIEEQNGG